MAPSAAELVARNKKQAANHQPLPDVKEIEAMGAPAPKTCIVTCIDPRFVPENVLGLGMGEAFVFRTIAGRPQSIFEQLIGLDIQSHGFEDVILMYHTDCGAQVFDLPRIRLELSEACQSKKNEIDRMSFNHFPSSIEQCLHDDISWLEQQPLMRQGLAKVVKGYVYDLKTGMLREVS